MVDLFLAFQSRANSENNHRYWYNVVLLTFDLVERHPSLRMGTPAHRHGSIMSVLAR